MRNGNDSSSMNVRQQHEENVNILVVDDRSDKLLAIQTVLAELGENVVPASSGLEALRILLKENFAVILLDVSMPGMDGFETAAMIRQRAASEHTPIIFVTSINTNETHVTRGYSLGAVDYIFSPVEPEILRAKVAVFIDLYKKNAQIRRQSELLRIAAEERAASLEARFQGLLNRLDVGVFRAAVNGMLIDANPAFRRLMGLAPDGSVNSVALNDLIPREHTASALAEHDRGGQDLLVRRGDGSEIWLRLNLATLEDPSGRQIVEGLVEDVSLRKEAEERLRELNNSLERIVAERTESLRISQEHLRRSERLASLGTLAAGIAHEINNPLNAILLTAKYAARATAKVEPGKAFEIICEEAMRGGRIVKGILKFAKEEKVTKNRSDLNEVIRHSRDLLRAYLPATKATIELDLCEDLPAVQIDPTAIEQVLVNLVSNSVEACEGTVQIILRSSRRPDAIQLDVEDTGPGIPQETLTHIFDPFFSTKRQQGGTGLGLSICHGIITEHGGTISVASEIGHGTKFSILLPQMSEQNERGHDADISG